MIRKKPSFGSGAAVAVSLAFYLFANPVSAQWAVYDAANNMTNKIGFIEQIKESVQQYQQQILQYEQQIQQYQQFLSKVKGLETNLSISPTELTPISDPDSLVSENCSGASGDGAGGFMNMLSSMFDQSISKSQQQICAQIVKTEIDKYNKTVDILNKMHQYNDMFQQIEGDGQSMSTLADTDRATNNTQVYSSSLETDMSKWRADMRADDAIISTLQQQQEILGRAALNGGNNGILDQALPDATFQAVISAIN